MKHSENLVRRWLIVVAYATAMAWVEAAVVFYLRTMLHRINPYQPNPLPVLGGLGLAELVRELSTLVMLVTVGVLAGRNVKSRVGYFVIAFGVWDIFYYVFLKALTGWPNSLLDWDLLFLVPLPWWGPVWAPLAIALLMILWGTLASGSSEEAKRSAAPWKLWFASAGGAGIVLYVFMADSLQVCLLGGSLRRVLPVSFDNTLFLFGLILMSAPVLEFVSAIPPKQRTPARDLDYAN